MRRLSVFTVTMGLFIASVAPVASASGPGGGADGGSGSSGGGSGGGTGVNAGSCSTISRFSNSPTYNPFYPSTNSDPATATVIDTQLTGTSTCSSDGPYTVRISYKNDSTNTLVQTNTTHWTIPGNLSEADGTFATPSTAYTVAYSVADGSGHVFSAGSQNVTTPPAK